MGERNLTEEMAARATAFAEANAIARPGDIVETTWARWKHPRKVLIVSVGAHLIADHADDSGFYLDFEMTYTAHRIRKDGSSAERVPESGMCLDRLTTADGRQWRDREGSTLNAKSFNHCVLAWRLARSQAVGAEGVPDQVLPTEIIQALRPFASGGNWGSVKAWIIAGASDRAKGIEAARAVTKWQAAVDALLARLDGVPSHG